jgi:hypothetical protein
VKRSFRALFLVALLVGGSLATVQPALAGCNVNVTFVNKDNKKATIHLADSKVKVKNGVYKKLGTTNLSVNANDDKQRSFQLDLGCSFQRRYKFYVTESGEGSKTIYKPNSTGFTTNTNLTVNINF